MGVVPTKKLLRPKGRQSICLEKHLHLPSAVFTPRALAPSCLVLDVSLPDLNGLELQKLIELDRFDLPIIFITGHGDIYRSSRFNLFQRIKSG